MEQKLQGHSKNKPIFNNLWMALPKYLCWITWVAQNKVIFKQENDTPRSIATKTKGLLAEFINSNQTINLMHETLDSKEERCISQFSILDQ